MNNSNNFEPHRTFAPMSHLNLPDNHFKRAALCSNGHLFSAMIEPLNAPEARGYIPIPNFCQQCGSSMHTDCPNCGVMISGVFYSQTTIYPSEYFLHYFCGNCSKPFPWAGTEQIILNFQNVLLNEVTDPALRLELKELIADLMDSRGDEKGLKRNWDLITRKANKFLQSPLVQTALTEAIKALFKSL